MALKLVTSYQKLLDVLRDDKYGNITFEYEGGTEEVLLPLDLTAFQCLSQMLEHEVVYYDPRKKIFMTKKGDAKPTLFKPQTPLT